MQTYEELAKFGVPVEEINELRRTKRAICEKKQIIAFAEGILLFIVLGIGCMFFAISLGFISW